MADYATLLRDHITLTCRSIDRIFLQAYVPKLQSVGQVCRFLHRQRGFPIPSSAAFGQIGEAYAAEIHRWAKANGIPIRYFAKKENKEKIAEPLLRAAAEEGGDGRVVLIGIAQEKASTWRSWKKKGQEEATHPHMEWGRQMGFINHFYFYLWDPEWGPAFWKTNAYAPYPIWLWLNGHSWAKRQLDKAGIAYQELDNGFRWCANPAALQRICNRLGPNAVHTFFWRWFHRLPSPFTSEDLQAGYAYELAFRQFEVSDTRVFDRPQTGRAFFEGVIRDHLDLGRPDQVVLVERALVHKLAGDAEIHGFQIASELGDGAKTLLSHGGLCKALGRLEEAGLLERRWEDPAVAADEGRPRRKYYRLTAEGQRVLYVTQQQRATAVSG